MSDQPPSSPPGSPFGSAPLGSPNDLPTREHQVTFPEPESSSSLPARASPVPLGGVEAARTTASQAISLAVPLERGATVGRYLILTRVGEGGMGVVYAAYDPELERTVAIKLLRTVDRRFGTVEEQQARLLREAQAMAKISHPNVISVYDVGPYGDGVFVALEFVDGVTLRDWIREKHRPWQEILDVFMKAGRGLAAAHAAGLVHRDFKPENVLVGRDGRVRVTDFGLARMMSDGQPLDDAGPLAPPSPGDSRGISTDGNRDANRGHVTRFGLLMGTPKYMSPEQHAGGLADARSDQFSFCAALYWGLYRKRPFDHRALAAATATQRKMALKDPGPTKVLLVPAITDPAAALSLQALVRDPPRTPRLPKAIRRALMRGLTMVPEGRHPSMDALLSALDAQPAIQRRRISAVAAALVVVLAGAPLYWFNLRSRCTGAEKDLSAVWHPAAQEAVDRALRGSGAQDAAQTAAKVRAVLDGYAGGWVKMRTDACRATRVSGEQTEHVLSLRMVCLDRRLKEVKAVVDVLSSADDKTAEKAMDAVMGLQGLKACADVEALTGQMNVPEDPAVRAAVEKAGTMLAAVKALHDAGKYQQAQAMAVEALATARTSAFRPVEAEALYWFGWLQALTSGDAKESERTLVQAVYAARAGRDDLTLIRAAVRLIYVLGALGTRYEDAHFWEGMIRAELERIGGNEELECQMLTNVGSVLLLEGRNEEAQRTFERALQLAEKDGSQRAKILSNLSVAYLEQKRFDEVLKLANESLDLITRTRGGDHISAAYAHEVLGRAHWGKGDYKNAHAEIERALAMYRRSLGPSHRQVSDGYDALAELLRTEGRFSEAVDISRRALELKERAIGKDHADLTYSLVGLGMGLLGSGYPAKAVPHFERALRLSVEDPLKQAEAGFGLARALWASGQERGRARALAQESLTVYTKRGNVEEARKITDWMGVTGISGSKKTARR